MSERVLCHGALMHILCILNFKMSLIKVEIFLGIFIINIHYHKDCSFHIQNFLGYFGIFLLNFDVQNLK
jgi:hypothetical protein